MNKKAEKGVRSRRKRARAWRRVAGITKASGHRSSRAASPAYNCPPRISPLTFISPGIRLFWPRGEDGRAGAAAEVRGGRGHRRAYTRLLGRAQGRQFA